MARTRKERVVVIGHFEPFDHDHVHALIGARADDREVIAVILPRVSKRTSTEPFVTGEAVASVLKSLGMVDEMHVLDGRTPPKEALARVMKKVRPTHISTLDAGLAAHARDFSKQQSVARLHGLRQKGKKHAQTWFQTSLPEALSTDVRPWGSMDFHRANLHFWLKTISVAPGQRTSLQRHKDRAEIWIMVRGEITAQVGDTRVSLAPGDSITIPSNTIHRLSSKTGGTIYELAVGPDVREDDIERLEDDYHRI